MFAAAFVVGLTAVLVATGGGLGAWDASYEARILPGVHVASVDVSGLDREAAVRALAAQFDFGSGSVVLRTSEGDIAIPYSSFGRRPDVDAMVDAAMRAGRDGSMVERALGEVHQALRTTTIEPRVTLDEATLSAEITAALGSLERSAENARIALRSRHPVAARPVVIPARLGRTVDPAPVVAAAIAAVRRTDAPAEVVIPVVVTIVPPAYDDEAALIAKVRAQRMIRPVVVTYGKKAWTVAAGTVRAWVTFENAPDGSIHPVIDHDKVAAALDKVAKGVLRKPASASFLTSKSDRVVGVVAGRDGLRLDMEATLARVAAELETRGDGNVARPVPAVVVPVTPDVTTEEAAKSAPLMVRLGTWRTWFPISERNYFGANIWRPAQIINRTVLAPGQRFEWWGAIGPVTSARGFGPGGVIKVDHTEPTGALGGGMCSSSTTLFNAALRSGLQMGARSNHRYYINRYPLGLDATVSKMGGSSQTMTFTNDTGHPIVIRGIRTRSGGRGFVRYEIWGIPDGRTVTLSRPIVTNVRVATTNVVYVTTLPHGVRKQTEYPSNGMDVSVTRTVRDAAGRIIHREVYRTHYQLWNGRIEVGI